MTVRNGLVPFQEGGAEVEYHERSAEDHLREYYDEADGVAGLRSVHGSMVDMRRTGAGGTRSPSAPEDKWPEQRRFAVRFHARTARALHRLTPEHSLTLWAFYGSPGWPGAAPNTTAKDAGLVYQATGGATVQRAAEDRKRWYRNQPPPEVVADLGEGLGRVALLTVALANAEAAWEADGHSPKQGAALLVALCASRNREAQDGPMVAIEREAASRHAAALAAFCFAAGLSGPKERKDRRKVEKGQRWTTPTSIAVVRGVRP